MRNDYKVLIGGGTFFAATLINFLSPIVLSFVRMGVGDGTAYTVWRTIIAIITQLLVAVTVFYFCRKTKTKTDYGLKKPSILTAGAGVVTAVIGVVGFYLFSTLFGYALGGMGYKSSTATMDTAVDWIMAAIRVIIFAPVCEEILFRGGVLSGTNALFLGKRGGEIKSILLCGALFMLLHMNPEQTVYQFLFGCLLAMLAMYCGSIIPAIIAHVINNIVALVLEIPAVKTAVGGGLNAFFTSLPVLYVFAAIVFAACALVGSYLLLKKVQRVNDNRGEIVTGDIEKTEEVIEPRVRTMGIMLMVAGAVLCVLVWVMQLALNIVGNA